MSEEASAIAARLNVPLVKIGVPSNTIEVSARVTRINGAIKSIEVPFTTGALENLLEVAEFEKRRVEILDYDAFGNIQKIELTLDSTEKLPILYQQPNQN